jgi:hypothetical protein
MELRYRLLVTSLRLGLIHKGWNEGECRGMM